MVVPGSIDSHSLLGYKALLAVFAGAKVWGKRRVLLLRLLLQRLEKFGCTRCIITPLHLENRCRVCSLNGPNDMTDAAHNHRSEKLRLNKH